jgi:NTE family protein
MTAAVAPRENQNFLEQSALEEPAGGEATLALMLGGGGARGAYQAGVLRGIASRFPELRFPVITGISAGAVNAIHLASARGSPVDAAERLVALWERLSPEQVYEVRALPLVANMLRWGARLLSGGMTSGREPMRGMIDTQPLRQFLHRNLDRDENGIVTGIARNIAAGTLRSVALSATSYATGKSVTWVEGKDVELWQRPQRGSEATRFTVEHVMASSALPMLFPAVRVGDEWYGDGGIRLTSPLSPALHLGATQILTISTRHLPAAVRTEKSATRRYPPPAQVMGVLYNSIFLDLVDEDILRLRKMNRLIAELPPDKREGMRVVEIMVIRPSIDLRTLANELEPRLPSFLRYLTRGLGTRQTTSTDLLSLILFQNDYIKRLIALGEADAHAYADDIDAFLERSQAYAGAFQ